MQRTVEDELLVQGLGDYVDLLRGPTEDVYDNMVREDLPDPETSCMAVWDSIGVDHACIPCDKAIETNMTTKQVTGSMYDDAQDMVGYSEGLSSWS